MDSANTCALDSPVEKRKIICHSVGRARYQNRFRAASQLVTNVSYSDSDKPTRNGMFQRFLSKRTKLISWVVQWFAPGLLCLSTLWGLDLSVVKSWALESQNSFGPGLTCWIYISSHRNSVSFFFFGFGEPKFEVFTSVSAPASMPGGQDECILSLQSGVAMLIATHTKTRGKRSV